MWPPETMYTNSSKHRNLYDSSTRSFYGGGSLSATNTSKSLKRQLFEQNSPEPMHPLIAARPCSKSVSIVATNSSSMVRANSADLGGLSALQSTLVKCGKLQIFDDLHEVKQEKEVEQCLKAQRSKMVRHSKWLQGKNSNPYECSSTLDCKSNPGD